MSFNQNTAMQEQPAGKDEGVSPIAPSVVAASSHAAESEAPQPSVGPGASALAQLPWFVAEKFGYKFSTKGTAYVAPLDDVLLDIPAHAETQIMAALKRISETDNKKPSAEQDLIEAMILTEMDRLRDRAVLDSYTGGDTEVADAKRTLATRAERAAFMAGSLALECANWAQREFAKGNKDIVDDSRFIAKKSKRDNWALFAAVYRSVVEAVASDVRLDYVKSCRSNLWNEARRHTDQFVYGRTYENSSEVEKKEIDSAELNAALI